MFESLADYLGLTVEQLRVQLAIVVSVGSMAGLIGGTLGYLWGWFRAKLDHRHHLDRDSILEANALFYHDEVMGPIIEVETVKGVHSLAQVFGNTALERRIGNRVGAAEVGAPLLSTGDEHYLAMGRVYAHVTGNSVVASQAVMFERFGSARCDMTAVYLTVAIGDDGQKIPYIVKANPKHLLAIDEELAGRTSFRDAHDRFLPLLRRMAEELRRAQELYDPERSHMTEVVAGKYAHVWLAPVRTPLVLTEDDVRRILREVLRAHLQGA